MPTYPEGLMNSAVAPVVVLKLATFPAPSCWTDRALPEAVLPTMKQLDVFKIVGTDGLKLIVFYLGGTFVSVPLRVVYEIFE
jgi:hypothetical protein